MKTTFLTILMAALLMPATYAQTQVPQAVQDAFSSRYPNAQEVSWEEEDGAFEAEFNENGKEVSVLFDEGGEWLQTETEIEIDAIPSSVLASIQDEFEGFEIEEAELVEKPYEDPAYELELENDEEESWEVMVLENGRIVYQEQEDDDEEEEED